MGDGVMNLIENGNIKFQYDGIERSTEDMRREGLRMLKSMLVLLAIEVVLIIGLSGWMKAQEPQSLMGAVSLIVFMVTVIGVFVAGSLLSIRLAYGRREERARNAVVDYFLTNKLHCGYFNGELRVECNDGLHDAILQRLNIFLGRHLGHLTHIEDRIESDAEKPVQVVISTLFENKLTVATVVNAE